MATNKRISIIKISDDSKIHSYIRANAFNAFQMGMSKRTIVLVPGIIKRPDMAYYYLSLLIRGIWKKYKIKVIGIIDGIEFEVVDGHLIEINL